MAAKPIPGAINCTEKSQDAVVEANRKLLLDRSNVGIQKYGVTLEKSGLTQRQYLQHALEEALDLSNYLQGEIQRLDKEARREAARVPLWGSNVKKPDLCRIESNSKTECGCGFGQCARGLIL